MGRKRDARGFLVDWHVRAPSPRCGTTPCNPDGYLYPLLLPILAALCKPACGDDGSSNESGSTGAGSTDGTSGGDSERYRRGDDGDERDGRGVDLTRDADADSTTGDAESSGGDSSSSSGGEADVCAPELGLYANEDCTTLAEGIDAFEPQYKLRRDGLVKSRSISLPGAIDSSDADDGSFPVGTVLWKHFETAEGLPDFGWEPGRQRGAVADGPTGRRWDGRSPDAPFGDRSCGYGRSCGGRCVDQQPRGLSANGA